MLEPILDILVPTHNHLEQTMRCLIALYRYTATPFHLIVTDDSNDGLTPRYLERLQKDRENITYIHTDTPYKNSYEFINKGLEYCETPYMALVVNSVTVEPDWETAGLHLIKTEPKIGVIGFKCLTPVGIIESAGLRITEDGSSIRDIGAGQAGHRLSKVYECKAVQWAFVLLRKEAVIGTMDECPYNGFRGWEEFETCFTIRENGWGIIYCGLGVGYHQAFATREKRDEEALRQNLENREIFAKRWGFWPTYSKIFGYLGEARPDVKPRDKVVTPVLKRDAEGVASEPTESTFIQSGSR